MKKERILLSAVTALILASVAQGFASSGDGGGSMTVSPGAVPIGTTNNFVFNFKSPTNGTYDSGSRVTLKVPLGWTVPQNANASAPGFVQVSATSTQAVVSIRSITTGTGPWTITVDITTSQPGAGFNLMYSAAVAPTNMGIYSFKTHTKGGGGSLTSLKFGSPTVTVTDPKKVNTTTTLTSSANPILPGGNVTFNAAVTPSGAGTPSGTVTFMDGDVVLGSSPVDGTGHATLSINNFANVPDTHWISAEYLGDVSFNSSVSITMAQAVTPAPTPPTISISMNADGSAGLACAGLPGQAYSIQATTNLLNGPWVTLSSTALGTNGLSVVNDPDAPQYSSRFYRTMISY
jgi:Bacterial Ig-like domain (group 3)